LPPRPQPTAATTHRQDLTLRLTDAVKLVAAHCLRDEAIAIAYFRVELLQVPAATPATPAQDQLPPGIKSPRLTRTKRGL